MRGRFETGPFEVARKTPDFEAFCAQSCRILRRRDSLEDRRWLAVAAVTSPVGAQAEWELWDRDGEPLRFERLDVPRRSY